MSVLSPERARSDLAPQVGSATPGNSVEMCIRWLLAACSMGAATLHFAYSPSHLAEYWLYGLFFIVLAWFQMLWAVGVVLRPWRGLLVAGIAANAAVIVVWVLSRTVGVCVGPNATVSEAASSPRSWRR